MTAELIQFQREYIAKEVTSGPFEMSGTLCGCVCFHDESSPGTWCLTIPELDHLIGSLQAVREDVVKNSRPYGDSRIVEREG